eukprot:SM015050S01451  [mRNA]  locus=s15050:3:149:- [translate_table: standard]
MPTFCLPSALPLPQELVDSLEFMAAAAAAATGIAFEFDEALIGGAALDA